MYWGKPPYSFQVMSASPQSRQAILTAFYRDSAFLRPPYGGTPTVCCFIVLWRKTTPALRALLFYVCVHFIVFLLARRVLWALWPRARMMRRANVRNLNNTMCERWILSRRVFFVCYVTSDFEVYFIFFL